MLTHHSMCGLKDASKTSDFYTNCLRSMNSIQGHEKFLLPRGDRHLVTGCPSPIPGLPVPLVTCHTHSGDKQAGGLLTFGIALLSVTCKSKLLPGIKFQSWPTESHALVKQNYKYYAVKQTRKINFCSS